MGALLCIRLHMGVCVTEYVKGLLVRHRRIMPYWCCTHRCCHTCLLTKGKVYPFGIFAFS
jgi:hypothetical protein